MINKKILVFVLLMVGVNPSWASTNSVVYTISGNGTHSILIDFARIGSYTDPNGIVSTMADTYYADYLSGPYMNTGIEEYNYAFNNHPGWPEGPGGTVVVANKFGLQSASNDQGFFSSLQGWQKGVGLTYYPGDEFVTYAPFQITQKITTPINHTWFLMISGLMSMWCVARMKRAKQNA